jgi:hypothetical protein
VVFGTVWYGTHYYMEIQFFDKLRNVSPEKDILNYPTCFCYNTWSCPTASDTLSTNSSNHYLSSK